MTRHGKHALRRARASLARKSTRLTLGAAGVLLAFGMTAAFADAGSLDLQVPDRTGFASDTTDDGAVVEYIGDQNTSYGSTGTGTFESFVRTQASPSERGFNTDGAVQFATKSGKWTHSMKVSEIPVVVEGGQSYFELWADINESDSTKGIRLTDLEVYFTEDNELTGYPFSPVEATSVYDFAGNILINDVNQGSGRGDLRYLVPTSGITIPADCAYGDSACDDYFVLYTKFGDADPANLHASDGGFEEWKVKTYPFLEVSKTARTSYTRTFPWTIAKSATPATIDLFDGQTGSTTWQVDVTKGTGVDSGWKVEGEITVANTSDEAATVVEVTDTLSLDGSVTVVCAGVTFPATLQPGEDLDCTYAKDLTSGAAQVNTASAELSTGPITSGSADVTFGSPTTLVDDTIDVTDTNGMSWDDIAGTTSKTYSESFTCGADEGKHDNRATITQTGQYADASVQVNCYGLTVTKTADETFTRDYDWDIEKTRFIATGEQDGDGDPSTLDLAEGQSFLASYRATVTMTGSTDSAAGVSGKIRVTNDAPIAADDVAVTDKITVNAVETAVSVDCDSATAGNQSTVDVPANDFRECDYSTSLPSNTDGVNKATATLAGIGYDGTTAVDFTTPTTQVDECIDVTDDNGTPGDSTDDQDLGTVCLDDLDANNQFDFEYTMTLGPFACGGSTFTNTASFETTDDGNDTTESGWDSYAVNVMVECAESCTLTQGYWRTHNASFWGGTRDDDTWLLIGAAAEDTPFFLAAPKSYFDVMWIAPAGNPYYQLARQYIAAVLNGLNDADTSEVDDELAAAKALFETYTPAQVANAKGAAGKALKAQFVSLSNTLTAFNEGRLAGQHCDEDPTSAES